MRPEGAQGRLIDLLVILCKQRSTRLQGNSAQSSTPLSRPDQMVERLESTWVYMTPHRCERLIHVLSSWRLLPCRQNLPNNTTTRLNVSDQMVPHASRRGAKERLIDLLVILCKQRSTRLQRHPTQASTPLSRPDQMVERLESTWVYMTPHRCERLIHVLSSRRLPPCSRICPITPEDVLICQTNCFLMRPEGAQGRLIDLLVILCKQRSTRLQGNSAQSSTPLSRPDQMVERLESTWVYMTPHRGDCHLAEEFAQ